MIDEVKTLRVTCDRCGAAKQYTQPGSGMPKGWEVRSRFVVYGTGHYDHCTETDHLCPKCARSEPKRSTP